MGTTEKTPSADRASRVGRAPARGRHRRPSGRERVWDLRSGVLPLGGVLLVLLLVAQAAMALPAAAAGRPPGGALSDASVRNVDVSSPAIVRIATMYQARLTLHLCGGALTLPTEGDGYTIGGLGSGAFVSANGTILTADHVVDIQHADLVAGLIGNPRTAADVARVVNDAHCPGVPTLSADDIANGALDALGIAYTPMFSQPRYLVWQATSYTGPLTATGHADAGVLQGLLSAPSLPATILAESPFGQDDLALLQVSLKDTPSIALGNAQALAPEDALTLIGFPGNADMTSDGESGNPNNLLTPSVNTLAVSALKTNDDGALLIEVSGNVEHGDSGGPVLDGAGHLVGVVSFGGGDFPSGTSFLRSSASAQTLLSSTGIDTTPGAFERGWEQAFGDYAASYPGHWHVAARDLDALVARYPAFHGAQPYQRYADAAAQAEGDAVQVGTLALPLALLGAIVGVAGLLSLAIVVALLVGFSRRRAARREAAVGREAVPALVPAGTFGGYGPSSGYGAASSYGPPSSYGPLSSYGPPTTYGPPWNVPIPPSTPTATPPFAPPSVVSPSSVSPSSVSPSSAPAAPSWYRTPSSAEDSRRSPLPGSTSDGHSEYDSAGAAGSAWGMCTRGHAMAPGVIRCDRCGSPRNIAGTLPAWPS